ncbi:unnamed protein product [Hymenolepis diminuta]|uniref:SAYSvFN domain-containing protein n=1 Tax=Hymenolepis diminuta TaxID=6216 RepID=A0A564YRX6_HYMDI|nr:unnamed protein product [Hymenolepis diminuta]
MSSYNCFLFKTYREVHEELERLRASRNQQKSDTQQDKSENLPKRIASDDSSANTPSTQKSAAPMWWRFISKTSWRVQLAFTLLLWASLLNVGFGAAFLLCACLYWLYVWGTDPQRRTPRPNTILAGWYYDNTRVA